MSILWLAAYPKSGMTWLQFWLANYMGGKVKNSKEVLRRIPDIHRCQLNPEKVAASKDVILCKTHFGYSDKHPHIKHTLGYIYLLRHPKDILLSNLSYFKLMGNKDFDDKQFALEFIKHMGVPKWIQMGFGSWNMNISSWMMEATKKNHLFLRYEDMHASPSSCLERIIDFLDLEKDDDKIRLSVEASVFENMQRMEKKEKAADEETFFPGNKECMESGLMFINKGQTGQSLASISPEIDELFNQRFEQVLRAFGYK